MNVVHLNVRPRRASSRHAPPGGLDAAAGLDAAQGRACSRDRPEGCAGVGAEIVLTVDGELRKTRLFWSHEQAELAGAIADTRTMFEGEGWA